MTKKCDISRRIIKDGNPGMENKYPYGRNAHNDITILHDQLKPVIADAVVVAVHKLRFPIKSVSLRF